MNNEIEQKVESYMRKSVLLSISLLVLTGFVMLFYVLYYSNFVAGMLLGLALGVLYHYLDIRVSRRITWLWDAAKHVASEAASKARQADGEAVVMDMIRKATENDAVAENSARMQGAAGEATVAAPVSEFYHAGEVPRSEAFADDKKKDPR